MALVFVFVSVLAAAAAAALLLIAIMFVKTAHYYVQVVQTEVAGEPKWVAVADPSVAAEDLVLEEELVVVEGGSGAAVVARIAAAL